MTALELDASITLTWLLGDAKPADLAYAGSVLDALRKPTVTASVPVTWLARRHGLSAYDASYLELALRAGLPLATLDSDLAKAAKKAGVKRFAH